MIGITVGIIVILLCLIAAIGFLIFEKRRGTDIPGSIIGALVAVVILMGGALGFVSRGEDYDAHQQLRWSALNQSEIPALVAAGNIVFVDITADWCLSCRANRANATHREKVVKAFMAKDVVLMRGDWTLPDPAIERYLAAHGATGTPLNRVYGPAAPLGVTMPSVLTIRNILETLEYATVSE